MAVIEGIASRSGTLTPKLTIEQVEELRAQAVPFVPNRWNWLCDLLDSPWGLEAFFLAIFTIAFGPWMFDAWFGLGKNAALNAAFAVFYGIVISYVVAGTFANKFKTHPSVWRKVYLGDFFIARRSAVFGRKVQLIVTALEDTRHRLTSHGGDIVLTKVEYCNDTSVVIFWQEVVEADSSEEYPMVVLDTAGEEVLAYAPVVEDELRSVGILPSLPDKQSIALL